MGKALATSFNAMADDLKKYTEGLARGTWPSQHRLTAPDIDSCRCYSRHMQIGSRKYQISIRDIEGYQRHSELCKWCQYSAHAEVWSDEGGPTIIEISKNTIAGWSTQEDVISSNSLHTEMLVTGTATWLNWSTINQYYWSFIGRFL